VQRDDEPSDDRDAGACVTSPVVNYLSQSISVNSINCSLLDAEMRCRQAMRQSAQRRRRLISELAMRCPPLTVYGPASAVLPPDDNQFVWNHTRTRPFNAVDTISPSEAARLSGDHIKLIGDNTGPASSSMRLVGMLRETVRQYMNRELHLFAGDVVPALFDVLAARQCTSLPIN